MLAHVFRRGERESKMKRVDVKQEFTCFIGVLIIIFSQQCLNKFKNVTFRKRLSAKWTFLLSGLNVKCESI